MSSEDIPSLARDRDAIEADLDAAERAYQSQDPYRIAAGYDTAGQLYQELACLMDDPTVVSACIQAGQQYRTLAAQTRFARSIPTLTPRQDAGLLGINGRCDGCGRAWSLDPDTGCDQCPRLLFGPSPQSVAEAEQLPPPQPADTQL